MLTDPPDYEAIEAEMWLTHAKEVPSRLSSNDKDILKRIQTYIDRFGYSEDVVHDKIREDKMFAAHFSKEPRRTGFHERVAHEWLQKALDIPVSLLPKSGPKSLYVSSDGMILAIPKDESNPSKSLDFSWEINGTEFYAMHKYTKESGGTQDNTFKEMNSLLKAFQSANKQNRVLIIIVDGAYYDESRMKMLRVNCRAIPPKSYAAHIEEVPPIIDQYR